MPQFETARVILNGGPGSWNVPPTIVRRRSPETETFSMGSQPTASPIPLPAGAPAQLFRLDRVRSEADPNDRRFQFANLIFQGSINDFHRLFFDARVRLGQTMQIEDGIGPMNLPIELSCAGVHPLPLAAQANLPVDALKTTALAVVAFARRVFTASGRART
jgi:hypothetical protein